MSLSYLIKKRIDNRERIDSLRAQGVDLGKIDPYSIREEKYDLVFYGATSEIAKDALQLIVRDSIYGYLDRIYLIGRNSAKLEARKNELDMISDGTPSKIFPVLGFTNSRLGLERILEERENIIVIVTVDALPPEKRQEIFDKEGRVGYLSYNLPLIEEIIPTLKKYKDKVVVHVVTNPIEIIAYKIATEAGVHPRKVTGSCDVDRLRLRNILLEDYIKVVYPNMEKFLGSNAYVIGTHSKPRPLLNSLLIQFMEKSNGEIRKEELVIRKEQLLDIIRELGSYGKLQITKGGGIKNRPTAPSTGAAILEYIKSIMHGGIINAALPYTFENNEPVYLALPTVFLNGFAFQVLFDEDVESGFGVKQSISLDKRLTNNAIDEHKKFLREIVKEEIGFIEKNRQFFGSKLKLEDIAKVPDELGEEEFRLKTPAPAQKKTEYLVLAGCVEEGLLELDEGLTIIKKHDSKYIRKLKILENNGRMELFLGKRDGIERRDIEKLEKVIMQHKLDAQHERWGINSAAILGDKVYGGHFKFGLIGWNANKQRGSKVFPRGDDGRVRHVTRYDDHRVIFSHGTDKDSRLMVLTRDGNILEVAKMPFTIRALDVHNGSIFLTLDDGVNGYINIYKSLDDFSLVGREIETMSHEGEIEVMERNGRVNCAVALKKSKVSLFELGSSGNTRHVGHQEYTHNEAFLDPLALKLCRDYIFLTDGFTGLRWNYTCPDNPLKKSGFQKIQTMEVFEK